MTERFFQGETTLSEERKLYQLFRRNEVPKDLQPLRDMFLDLQATGFEAEAEPMAIKRPPHGHTVRWLMAATLILAIGLSAVLTLDGRQQDECEAYFYGHKTTDKDVVMAEMRLSAETMTVGTQHNDVENQLIEMFNME